MALTQLNRPGVLTTTLGQDVLCLKDFSGVEALGEIFEFHLSAFSQDGDLDIEKLLGTTCTVSLRATNDKKRYFNGVVTECQSCEHIDDLYVYRIVLHPRFWLLAKRSNCRIFLDKSVDEIITEVFNSIGFTEFDFRLSSSYDKIPYCVQYRETDFDFCMRLMEQFGIYFFFEHSSDDHLMVLVDAPSGHSANPTMPKLRVQKGDLGERVDGWVQEVRLRTETVEYNDYDYLKPGKKLTAKKEGKRSKSKIPLDVYDYPGKYKETGLGTHFSKVRLEAEQCQTGRRYIESSTPLATPGFRHSFTDNAKSSENRDFLVVRCRHRFGDQFYWSSSSAVDDVQHRGFYELLPVDRPFRLLATTPKPRIHGIQTARVIGKTGEEKEEISTDENGHIWVRFHWDREEKTSCPVRVAQFWSGKKWGEQHIPRLGMEVVVEFLEGDPDRPLVVGTVYNGDNKFPYDLPAEKTKSGVKSDSTKGHGGYNELMFEDKKGSELFRIHAEKDQLIQVNNNVDEHVGYSATDSVGKDKTINVGMDAAKDIAKGGGNLKINAFKTISLDVGLKEMPLTHIVMTNQDITLSVGPKDLPMTSIKMTMTDITLSVGPEGLMSKIVLSLQGISLNVLAGLTSHNWSPGGTSLTSPTISETAMSAITLTAPAGVTAAPTLNTPALVAGGAIVGGIPI